MLPSASRERPGYRAGGETPPSGTPTLLAASSPAPACSGRTANAPSQQAAVSRLRFASKVLGHNLDLEANPCQILSSPLLPPLPPVPGVFASA